MHFNCFSFEGKEVRNEVCRKAISLQLNRYRGSLWVWLCVRSWWMSSRFIQIFKSALLVFANVSLVEMPAVSCFDRQIMNYLSVVITQEYT